MDGLKKLLIGNKLNHLTTARIPHCSKCNRKNTRSVIEPLLLTQMYLLFFHERTAAKRTEKAGAKRSQRAE